MSAARPPAGAQAPLSVTWREWVQPREGADRSGEPFDAIVVGSGYGGSVAALRLAQKGWRVLLLEKGSEYLPGEFPNDFSLVPKFFRLNVPGTGAPLGRASGLFEVHLGEGMVAVGGNGLGGGSLINAGVVMHPDEDVFTQPEWPAAIRHGREGGLAPFFERAGRQLRATEWVSGLPDQRPLDKTAGLHRIAHQLGRPGSGVKLTVDPQKCTRCGDCAAGCNTPDAKGTLASTYLREAAATGRVQIVTQAEVYRFEPAPAGDPAGWSVHVFATDAQHQFAARRELFAERQPSATWRVLRAPMLFVCAGTVGTTQLLQRSQALAGGRLAFSPALGTRVSGNGDSLSWVTNEAQRVGGVSRGPEGVAAWERLQRQEAFDPHAIVGPTITGAVDLRQPLAGPGEGAAGAARLPLQERILIEDCAVPRAIAQLFRELLATTRTLRQLDGWWFRGARFAGAAPEDPLAASEQQAQHAQTLLAMGHDGSPARLVWLEGLDSSAPWLPEPEQLRTYQRQQEIFECWGVRHVHNPLWEAMPRDAKRMITGPKPPHTVTTVHPLGGCAMSDDPAHGVVNDRGQVWVDDPGRGLLPPEAMDPVPGSQPDAEAPNAPRLYRGLYVLDGSIVPTSLGCNPLWTITALAERALEAIPPRPQPLPAQRPARSAPRTPQPGPSTEPAIDALLHEVLIAREARVDGAFARFLGSAVADARLEATFVADDITADMRSPLHRTPARGTLSLAAAGDGKQPVLARYAIAGGDFTALPSGPGSTGPLPLVRSIVESLVALGAAAVAGWAASKFASPLLAPPAALLALLVAAGLLPFPRSGITWLVLRGTRDILEQKDKLSWNSVLALKALWKQLVHASEKRVMRYRMRLELQEAPAAPQLPRTLTLVATKRVSYRASVGELVAWLLGRRQPCEAGGTERVPLRPTFWEQIMDADLRVLQPGRPAWAGTLLRGRFRMGFDNLTSSGLSPSRRNARGAMELGLRGDTTSGALALAGYPLLFLRFGLKTRLLDFRLPTYSDEPVPDCAPACETELRIDGQRVAAERHDLVVERGSSSSDDGSETRAPLQLPLWRYRRPGGAPEIVPGRWMGVPVARAKSVLLLHAFGQSGLTYTLKTVEENLAERFWREGYEVWVLEMRMSSRSGYAEEPCSIDQIASNDIPTAVKHIVDTIAREGGLQQPVQIGAFAQCIGSAALWMATLSGRLSHARDAAWEVDGTRPQLSMLSHAMFSQVHPWIVGARGTQSKTWVPDLLHVLWRRGAVPFAVRGPQGLFAASLDRLLASLPVPQGERRRPRRDDDAQATCRRIRFIEAPLFQHRNLNEATLAAMNLLFGDANLRLFAQARRFVDRERLVDEDGVNRYVTDDNLRRHLAFPVQLLHGAANELFDVESAQRSFARLGEVHGRWQSAFCREGPGLPQPVIAPGYGHLDVLIGQAASTEVYPRILGFFQRALQREHHRVRGSFPGRWAARAPALGPFVGWLRQEQGRVRLRLSFAVDDRGSRAAPGALPPVVVRYRSRATQAYRTLSGVAWTPYPLVPSGQPPGPGTPCVALFGCADLDLPEDWDAAHDWQLFTLHESRFVADGLLTSATPGDAELDAYLAHAGGGAPADPIVPALSDGERLDLARASFRLPPQALETLAAADSVRFAASCCRHPGVAVDVGRVDHTVKEFLRTQQAQRPVAFAMLLGDQIYADATAGLMDPWSPYERFCDRHAMAFDREGLGRLLAAMPVYLTPDDHEWTDAFPLEGPLLREHWGQGGARQGLGQRNEQAIELANRAVTAFQRLQGPPGPVAEGLQAPLPAAAEGRGYDVFRHGCARVFVIDSRIGRDRNAPRLVADAVLAALASWLNEEEAASMLSVVACGSVVLPGLRPNWDPANPGAVDTWQYAPGQRATLLDNLATSRAAGRFVLLSGDYHVSGAARVQCAGQVIGMAVVVPPLYAPMPYANATPEAVDLGERIPLRAGELSLQPLDGGGFERGSGLAVLDVRAEGSGFTVKVCRELQVWEEGVTRSFETTLHLPGSAALTPALPPEVPPPAPAQPAPA